jgi:hypothetical protein
LVTTAGKDRRGLSEQEGEDEQQHSDGSRKLPALEVTTIHMGCGAGVGVEYEAMGEMWVAVVVRRSLSPGESCEEGVYVVVRKPEVVVAVVELAGLMN